MKRFLAMCAVLLIASSAYAADYYWDCTTTGSWPTYMPAGVWDCATNWNPDGLPGAADNAWVQNGGTLRIPTVAGNSPLNNVSITYGQFVIANGSNMLYPYSQWTLNVVDDCGGTGDFIIRTTAGFSTTYSGRLTANIDGNVLLNNTTTFYAGSGGNSTWNLYGTNKAFRNRATDATSGAWITNIYGSYYDNGAVRSYTCRNVVKVKTGGQIITAPLNVASAWWARNFVFESGQANLPNLGDCVTFGYQPFFDPANAADSDNGPAGPRLVITGGVVYPWDVRVGCDYWGTAPKANGEFNWRIKGGDFTVGRDFQISETAGGSPQAGMFVNFEENGTGAKVKVSVLRDLLVGNYDQTTERYGIRVKNSTIRVGRDLALGLDTNGYYGWTTYRNRSLDDLGNGTIYVGRNLVIWRMDATAKAFWNPGTSTIICDGCGIAQNQIIRTFGYIDGVALNNLVIDNPLGSVILDNANWGNGGTAPYIKPGGILLHGDLTINTRFNDSDLPIAFNGPDHHLTIGGGASLAGGSLDNVFLLTNAVLRLGSDVTMDNLEMQSGSKLYLNGFTLVAEGQTFVSDLIDCNSGVPCEQGMIYGTLGAAVPEPTTLLLLGTGALGVFGYIRRRRMA